MYMYLYHAADLCIRRIHPCNLHPLQVAHHFLSIVLKTRVNRDKHVHYYSFILARKQIVGTHKHRIAMIYVLNKKEKNISQLSFMAKNIQCISIIIIFILKLSFLQPKYFFFHFNVAFKIIFTHMETSQSVGWRGGGGTGNPGKTT